MSYIYWQQTLGNIWIDSWVFCALSTFIKSYNIRTLRDPEDHPSSDVVIQHNSHKPYVAA